MATTLLGVPPPAPPRAPSSPPPLAVSRSFRPYYSPLELDHLVQLQATQRQQQQQGGDAHAAEPAVMSDQRINHYRQLACGFIQRVAGRLGFPRRTTATAQKLYHRFHLNFPLADFAYQDVSLATLLVASKLEDTLKKLRDIQIAGWQVLNMMDGGDGRGEGDLSLQESHRPQLIGIERLVLQTISFNFNLHRSLLPPASSSSSSSSSSSTVEDLPAALLLASAAPPPTRDAFTYLLRLSSLLPSLPPSLPQTAATRKSLTYLAFLLLSDLHRTLAPLSYPPHTCAAACLWTAGVLLVVAGRNQNGGGGGGGAEGNERAWGEEVAQAWAQETESEEEDVDDISQTLLTLLISLCPSPPSSSFVNTNSNTISPLFSPSNASPSETTLPSSLSSSAGPSSKPSAALSEREKHLLAAGVPNAFSHPAALPSPTEAGGSKSGFVSPDALTSAKILLRSSRPPPSASSSISPRKRPLPPSFPHASSSDALDPRLLKSSRWSSLPTALASVGRLRDERLERERIRAEERLEKEREREEEGKEGGEGGGRTSRAKTQEEREQERRERRERGRAGSTRYQF